MPRIIDTPIGTIEVHAKSYPAPNLATANRVVDGDTFVIGGQHWRLYGWDAPPIGPIGTVATRNSGKYPHCPEELERGWEAKRLATALIADAASRRAVHVIIRDAKDNHQRWLVTIHVDGEDLGMRLFEKGLAERYDGQGPKWGFCDCAERRAAYDQQLEVFAESKEERRRRARSARAAIR